MAFTVTESVTDTFELLDDVNGNGTRWELTFDILYPHTEYFVFLFNYTQDASASVNLSFTFEDYDIADEFFQETILDTNTSTPAVFTHSAAGRYRIVVPVMKNTNKIRCVVEPDVATGNDTFVVHGNENKAKAGR